MKKVNSISDARTITLAAQWFHNMYRETLKGTREMQEQIVRYETARAYLVQHEVNISHLPERLEEGVRT